MKKIALVFSFVASLFSVMAQNTAWKITPIKVVNHNRQANILDTLTPITLNANVPNIEIVSKDVSDSVNVCLQTINLPKLTKSCDFQIMCSTYSFASTDSVFTSAIGKVLFVSNDANRKIFTTATTGANKVYAVRSSTKAITNLLPGYIVRVHFVTNSTGGTYYISEPVAMR